MLIGGIDWKLNLMDNLARFFFFTGKKCSGGPKLEDAILKFLSAIVIVDG